MCRVDDGEPCEFFHAEERRAGKTTRCDECGRAIVPGELYQRAVYKVCGDFGSDRVCAHCQVACAWLVRECGGYVTPQVLEDLVEHWREGGVRTRELATLIHGMRKKWKRRDGRMKPVPTLATPEPEDRNA